MKRYWIILAAAAALCGCQRTETEAPAPVLDKGRVITVNTMEDTRSSIAPGLEGGYTFTWDQGDGLQLYEFVYENYGEATPDATWSDFFWSDALDQASPTASFTVNLNSTLANPNSGQYRYVGAFPIYFQSYWSAGEPDRYDGLWGDHPGAAGLAPHAVLSVDFPYQQYPKAGTFDPSADLLVSRPAVQDTRAEGSLNLSYTRLGAIVKVSLTGLAPEEKIISGYLLFGDSYKVNGKLEYDPEIGDARFEAGEAVSMSDYNPSTYMELWSLNSASAVQFTPDEVYADGDGRADIWLRLPAGQVSDSFSLRVWTCAYDEGYPSGDVHRYGKDVDLAALSRSLSFSNGRMTTFSVAAEEMPLPYIRLSYTYTDQEGDEQTDVSNQYGNLTIGDITRLPCDAGQVVLDVETNIDPTGLLTDADYYDWVDAAFDPATMKFTISYQAAPYKNGAYDTYRYANGIRLYSSEQGVESSATIYQQTRVFDEAGRTRKSMYVWYGGSASGTVSCNFDPVIDCPTAVEDSISWLVSREDGTCEVTFTAGQSNADAITVVPAYIRDPLYPDEKYMTVNIVRFPMLPDGDYYIAVENSWSGTLDNGKYPWFAAAVNPSNGNNVFAAQVAYDGDKNLDFANTEYVRAFTFQRIDGSTDYRISYKVADVPQYFSLGSTYASGSLYVVTNAGSPLVVDGRDLSRWDVQAFRKYGYVLNHAYENVENHTGTYGMFFNLRSRSEANYYVKTTNYNKDTYSWSIGRFSDFWYYAYSGNGEVKLINADTGAVFPQDRNDY